MPRIISDVHGKFDQYIEIAKASPDGCSIQLGDMGFDYLPLKQLDSSCHKFIGGNHDNYDTYRETRHSLGNFGIPSKTSFFNIDPDFSAKVNDYFFVRGSISIDAASRVLLFLQTGVKTWWYDEELTAEKLDWAYKHYCVAKPRVMLTHDCPLVMKEYVRRGLDLRKFGFPESDFNNLTQIMLQKMFEFYQPEIWIFGHWHINCHKKIGNTNFMCMRELEFIDL